MIEIMAAIRICENDKGKASKEVELYCGDIAAHVSDAGGLTYHKERDSSVMCNDYVWLIHFIPSSYTKF